MKQMAGLEGAGQSIRHVHDVAVRFLATDCLKWSGFAWARRLRGDAAQCDLRGRPEVVRRVVRKPKTQD